MAMTVCGGTPILHDDTQNLKEVFFADHFFLCKVVGCFFLDMSNLITDTVIYITERKLTNLKEKLFYCGTNFLNTL